jgi:putative Mg2+ transporter-C (MgtC) family protein
LTALVILLRILATFFLSLIFGFERQKTHKPVGFGTFSFVSLGACGLGVIASYNVLANSASLLSGIVTGIGFLGAGALVRGTDRVFGFTTASAIWLFAILGLTIGIGEYLIAGIVYVLAWVIIYIDRHFERKGISSYQRKLNLRTNHIVPDKDLNRLFLKHSAKHTLLCTEIDKIKHEVQLTFLIDGSREHLNQLMHELYEQEWFAGAKIE